MYNFTWAEDREKVFYDKAQEKMNNFFDKINSGKKYTEINGYKLSYRANQHKFANDVMKAIRDKELLLIQAGVGIGKSMGYLIPIFSTFNNVENFENIVISTSNIGLQQQLLTDINQLSNMLGIKMDVSIAKGISNYACIAKIDKMLINASKKDREVLEELKRYIDKYNTIDKDELIEVGNRIWNSIQMSSRGPCSRCNYSQYCLHRKLVKKMDRSSIIITNHDYLAKSILADRDFVDEADMFVIDEAHNFEKSIRNVSGDTINIDNIRRTLTYYINFIDNRKIQTYIYDTINELYTLFNHVMRRGSAYYRANSEDKVVSVTECANIPFKINKMEREFENIVNRFDAIINYVQSYNHGIGNFRDYRVKKLSEWNNLFRDILKKDRSNNIYWVNFYDRNKIEIGYTVKDTSMVTDKLFCRDVPIVCTSATLLDANGSYDYIKSGLSIDKISPRDKTVVNGRVYHSPYDYDKNSLFYYDKDISNPNDIEKYKKELVEKVTELIKVTNGRALVLFTSKAMMNYVYDNIDKSQFDFKIMKQGNNVSNSQLSRDFEKDVKSCLFATGAFWEGVDIEGRSLSNVIITRLPFANVDAIMKAKELEYKDDSFRMVYLNDMIQKLTQGTGRLIRGSNDKGIVACLDSRFENYIDIFKNVTDFTCYTDDIKDVYDFSSTNITNRDGKRGKYKARSK